MAFTRWLVLLIVVAGHFTASAKWSPKYKTECEKSISTVWYDREFSLEAPKWNDNLGVIRSSLEAMAWSSVRTYFSKEWDTQVYYTATGVPQGKDLKLPLVDPDAKAVVLFIHGSGTAKSSGANFIANMSQLANLGFAAVSIDLPFHSNGSLREKYNNADDFMAYMKKIVKEIAAYGKPVYLAGHSFGPDVIFEMVSRDPFLVAGALGMSPAGFNKTLDEWYAKYTSKMKFGGAVMENVAGSQWAGTVSSQFGWSKGVRPDPTLVNPSLNLNILYGDREEYYPAPVGGPNRTPIGRNTYDVAPVLRGYFANANLVVAEGIGHYLFDHKDANGHVVVQRELLKMLGTDIRNSKELTDRTGALREARGYANKLAYLYRFDYVFMSWFAAHYDARLIADVFRNQDQRRAQALLQEYQLAVEAKMKEIMKEVAQTQFTDHDFYLQYQRQIEDAIKKNRIAMDVITKYYQRKTGGDTVTIN